MKKLIITSIAFLFITVFTINAQEQEDLKPPKFEISLDAYQLLNPKGVSGISLSFDYLLNKSESIGSTTSIKSRYFSQSLNYKHYFSKKYAQGFYTELGMSYVKGQYVHFPQPANNPYNYEITDFDAINLDLKLGYKFVSKKNIFVDVFAGLSKTMFGDNRYLNSYYNSPINYGVKIGKRF